MPPVKELNYKSIHKWCEHFLYCHGFLLRKLIGQEVKDIASNIIMKFLIDINQKIII